MFYSSCCLLIVAATLCVVSTSPLYLSSSTHDNLRTPTQSDVRSHPLDHLLLLYEVMEALRDHPMTHLNHDDAGQCIWVKSEEGTYMYTSPGEVAGSGSVCGLYIIADPDQVVELEFLDFDVACGNGGLVSVIDGWEMNGQFFPGTDDHVKPRHNRYREYCGIRVPMYKFTASQNVGLIEFRIPEPGDGFMVRVRFRDNPFPCNAVLYSVAGVYTLTNYGQRINCSVSILFPQSFALQSMSIGTTNALTNFESTAPGVVKQCYENGHGDYLEIRGGDGLDPRLMAVVENVCGELKEPASNRLEVACDHTALRLVSSGNYNNTVTVAFELSLDMSSCPRALDVATLVDGLDDPLQQVVSSDQNALHTQQNEAISSSSYVDDASNSNPTPLLNID